MKKVLSIMILLFISNCILKAQNAVYTFKPIDQYLNKFEKKDIQFLLPFKVNDLAANILIVNKTRRAISAANYSVFYDTLLNNSCKRINDSIYDINIKNPSKPIFIAVDTSNINWGINSLFPQYFKNIPYSMGFKPVDIMTYDINAFQKIGLKDNELDSSLLATELMPLNNSDYSELTLFSLRNKNIKYHFRFHFHFAKPIVAIATIDSTIINEKISNPSAIFYDVLEKYFSTPKIPTNFSKDTKRLLLVFKHFGGSTRLNDKMTDNDMLQYKVDDSKIWQGTAASITPSILLENISSGKHLLQVRYPSENADILIYNFEILPN